MTLDPLLPQAGVRYSVDHEIGAATRQRPAPRHQEQESMMQSKPTALQRIIADNDPRNGSIVTRLIRLLEHPERCPDEDGLYHDEKAGDTDA